MDTIDVPRTLPANDGPWQIDPYHTPLTDAEVRQFALVMFQALEHENVRLRAALTLVHEKDTTI
jgi:hypothetical protein